MDYRNPFGNQTQAYAQSQATTYDAGLRAYFLKIYNLMASALAVTGITALFTANSPAMQSALYVIQDGRLTGMTGLGTLVAFAPLAYMLVFMFGLHRMQKSALQLTFWSFAVVMGLSSASLLWLYTGASVARVFFITAAMFGGMSLYGYTTKRDLSAWTSFLYMGMWGLFLGFIVNGFFLQSTMFDFVLSGIGVVVFVGMIAHDTQMLKSFYYQSQDLGRVVILGALHLYLDFINLFFMLLRFVGDRR
jgi:FtsH-binding integral membrane protein